MKLFPSIGFSNFIFGFDTTIFIALALFMYTFFKWFISLESKCNKHNLGRGYVIKCMFHYIYVHIVTVVCACATCLCLR